MRKYLIGIAAVATLASGVWLGRASQDAAAPAVMATQMLAQKGPDAATVVSVSLKAIQNQSRLSAMQARYVAVVTSTERRLGVFESRKTLVLPGRVRYEVDLSRLRRSDLDWNAKTATLRVRLPAIEVSGVEFDLDHAQNFTDGMLTAFSGVSDALELRNRRAAQMQLLAQVRDAAIMAQARASAARSLQQMFDMPLRAADVRATIIVT